MNPSMRQLRAFVALFHHGSFTQAADRLHVTQAGLSAMIRELEAQAGTQLFVRTTRKVEITKAGLRLLPHVKTALDSLDRGIKELESEVDRVQRRLRVGLTPLIAATVLPTVCRNFLKAEPYVELDIVDTDRAELQRMVEAEELDAAFGFFFDRDSGLERTKIFATSLALIAPAQSIASSPGTRATFANTFQLARTLPLITLRRGSHFEQFIQRFLLDIEYPVVERKEVLHLATLISMVDAGLGWAVVPGFALLACQRYENVREIAVRSTFPALDFFCVAKRGRHLPDGLQLFTRALEQECTRVQ